MFWLILRRKALVLMLLALQVQSSFGEVVFLGTGGLSSNNIYSVARGLSADGSTVVGVSLGSDGLEAFHWTRASGMQGLGYLSPQTASPESQAYGASGDGSVIAGQADSRLDTLSIKPFRWTESGGMEHLGHLPNASHAGFARAISNAGRTIVGRASSSNGDAESFRWTESEGMQGLGDLSGGRFFSEGRGVSGDGQVAVGYSESSSGNEAFRWNASSGMQGLGDLAGGTFYSVANDAAFDGSVVVGYGESANGTEAFRWTESEGMLGLGDLEGGSFGSIANATSADGGIAAGVATTADGNTAFVWDSAKGMRSMQDMLASYGLDTTGWQLNAVTGISDDGLSFTGTGVNPDGNTEGWYASIAATSVPEPSSWAILGAAAMGLMYHKRRIAKQS